MAMRRRKIWVMMSKKELGKVQRAKTNNHKEMLISCKKVAQHCMRHWRQKAMQVSITACTIVCIYLRMIKEFVWFLFFLYSHKET